jgi:hypothetical protein
MKTERKALKRYCSCCKDRVSARIAENRARMKKLGLKQDSRDLSDKSRSIRALIEETGG